jgi:nicotinate-nucleotide pyrophosphorylase (carboxylating)
MDFDKQLELLVIAAIAEDVGSGDHSTLSTIPPDANGKAQLKIKEDGVLAGVAVAEKIFHQLEPGSSLEIFKQDGDLMKYGEVAFIVSARVHTILQGERLVLNVMQRMSGIATLTRKYAAKLQGFHTRVLDTRKTTPNFRLLEKEAVRIGGGINHRFGLFDMIMLKDNHIDFCGGIEKAINRAYDYVQRVDPNLKIEVETRSVDDVKRVVAMAKGKVFRIMLDNFTPAMITEAMPIINGEFETEASGGINLDNIIDYAQTGVDYVSVGALIHQARSLDLSLKAM